MLRSALAAVTVATFACTAWATNPPDEENCENSESYRNSHPEECCNSGDGSGVNSLGYFISFGGLPFEEGLERARIAIHQEKPTPTIFTPQSVRYESVFGIELTSKSTGAATWEFRVLNEKRRSLLFQVAEGSSLGAPAGDSVGADYVLALLSATGQPVHAGAGSATPALLSLRYGDGRKAEIDYETGRIVRFVTASGRVIDLQNLPQAIATDLVWADSVIRQIKAPAGLADFVQVAEQAFEARFYVPAAVGSKNPVTGIYSVSGSPYRVVKIENATSQTDDFSHVKITENWGTRTKIDVFDYNDAVSQWQLSTGVGGLERNESKTITPGPGADETTITRVLRDASGNAVSTLREIKREFAWGTTLVSRTQEPNTLNLTTTYAYHAISGQPGYSKMKSRERADGSWETLAYDAQGRVSERTSPWKDTAIADFVSGPRVITTYAYLSLDANDVVDSGDERPRTVTQAVVTATGGSPVVTKRTYYVYKRGSDGVYTEIEENAASSSHAYGASGNLRATRVFYTTDSAQSGYDADSAGRLHYEIRPDGVQTTYLYTRDPLNTDGYWTVAEIVGAPSAPEGIDGLSTKIENVYDSRGNLVLTRSYIRSGGAWHQTSVETRTVNAEGFHVATHRDNRMIYSAAYDAQLLVSQTREDGVTTLLTYDSLDKLESETRLGLAAAGPYEAQADIVTTYLREMGGLDCGCDGEVVKVVSAGGLSVATKSKKDLVGRTTYEKDSAGLETFHSYALGGRQVTRTSPDGGTRIQLKHRDRRVASITGTGVVPQYHDYGVNADGTTWTKVTKVSPAGARWEKVTTNWLGQTIAVERPAYDGGVAVTSGSYDLQGRLVRVRQHHLAGVAESSVVADTRTEYDVLGNVVREGVDIDGDGALVLGSSDRITDTIAAFSYQDSAWWGLTRIKVYPEAGSSTAVQLSEVRQRLSGFSGALAAEVLSVDVEGNLTRRKTEIDIAAKLTTVTVQSPNSALPSVSITRNGLLVEDTEMTGEAPTLYKNDALGRITGAKSPRHSGWTSLAYDATTGWLASQSDAAGGVITYAYYVNGEIGAGRPKLITDALGNTLRSSYDSLGRLAYQWGTAGYPQAYAYTANGELATLTTWRDVGSANLNAATWPAPAGGDATTWVFQESTGLLLRKEYADGRGAAYAYDHAGRLLTRTWARVVAGQPLMTSYSYDVATGELLTIDYSDGTPDVAVSYDRLGRRAAVTDATGTRTFTYDPLKLRSVGENLSSYYGNRIIKRRYQGAGSGEVPGRAAGFELGSSADPDADHAVLYGYDEVGRLNSAVSPSGAFSYAYTEEGDLVSSLTSPVHVAATFYAADRDVVASVENKRGSLTVSQYQYTTNAIGQRTGRTQSGSAFAQAAGDLFGYDSKGEITSVVNATHPARNQTYAFDEIGNRKSLVTVAGTESYTANQLNQYTAIQAPGSSPRILTFDWDGNLAATDAGQSYSWDAENRLVGVEPVLPVNGSRKVLNTYDSQNRRVRRQVFNYSGGAWTLSVDEKFIYDDWSLIATLRWNPSTASFEPVKTFTWGLDLSRSLQGAGGVGGLLAAKDGGVDYYYTYDANGNVSEVLDGAGAVAAHYEYDPFGGTVLQTGVYAAANEFRFSTKAFDGVSGTYYYGHRFYDPAAGRWVNRDPIAEGGGLNLYWMVANDPVSSVDKLGMSCVKVQHSIGLGGIRKSSIIGKPRPTVEGMSTASAKGMGVGFFGEGSIDLEAEVCDKCCPDGSEGHKISGSALATLRIGASVASYSFAADVTFRAGKWAVSGGVNAWAGARVYGQVFGKAGAEVSYETCTGSPSLNFKLIVGGEFGLELGGEATAYLRLSYGEWLSISKRLSVGVAGGGRVGIEWDADVSCDRSSCRISGPTKAYVEGYVRAVFLGFNAEMAISGEKPLGTLSVTTGSPLSALP